MSSSTTAPDQDHPTSHSSPAGQGDVFVLAAEDFSVVDSRGGRDGRDDGRAPHRVEHAGSGQRVTSARGSHSDDVARRMRTYAISMGIRTLCVLGAVLSFPHWWAWLFVPGAVVLPYVAVVLANVGGERAPVAVASVTPTARPGLPRA